MTWLVSLYVDGEVQSAKLCRSLVSRNRWANQLNEYVQLHNKLHPNKHLVLITPSSEIIHISKIHEGLPKHTPKKELAKRKIAKRKQEIVNEFLALPIEGNVQ